ncbi:hypothetical protein TNCT_572611 [Trichonephila clavata]|uniref:Uncharacterized protein n=1 Tax=Trichonephila clavata TaxID=2740835 RepID=A0A8X6HDT8_TRICU|nr:hypothetical protein TNCT_572611 [Trichonephila clavata]
MQEESKPSVVTPTYQQKGSLSTFRGTPEEDHLKWLKEYDRVTKLNNWDDMMFQIEADPQHAVSDRLRRIVDLVDLQAVRMRKTINETNSQGDEAACYENPHLAADW